MVAALCAAFLISQFYRASIGVLGPTFMAEMGLSASMLGVLGGVYFIVFAAAQVPCGVLLDQYGPRLVNAVLLMLAAGGAVIFATAREPAMLTLGRGIIGLGCATCFMGSLVVFSRWFPPRSFPLMAAIASGIGGGGALIATTPLAIAAEWFGWRGTFFLISAITAVVAALVWMLVRNAPPGEPFHVGPRETFVSAFAGVGKLVANRQLRLLIPLNTVSYGSIMVVLALWGAPYLRDVHSLSTIGAANILMTMAVSAMAGGLFYAWLAPRIGSIKTLVLAGSSSTIIIFVVLAILPQSNHYLLLILLGLLGLVGSYPVLIVSHVRMLVPKHLVGRGLTLSNLFSFGGVGLLQLLSGWIIGFFAVINGARPPAAYSTLFYCVAAVSALAMVVYIWIEDPSLDTKESV